jgi:hypothetical protein
MMRPASSHRLRPAPHLWGRIVQDRAQSA